jgi:hypothetical protein
MESENSKKSVTSEKGQEIVKSFQIPIEDGVNEAD